MRELLTFSSNSLQESEQAYFPKFLTVSLKMYKMLPLSYTRLSAGSSQLKHYKKQNIGHSITVCKTYQIKQD